MKPIYSRISNHRDRRFQIETVIYKKGKHLVVSKRPYIKEALPHVLNLKRNYDLLTKHLPPEWLIPVSIEGDAAVSPYIHGNTLEYLALNGEVERAIGLFSNMLIYNLNVTDFVLTEEFKNIFGDITLPKCKASIISNVDLSFDNIIYDGRLTKILDCEWVFPFPIPLDFIKYRVVNNFLRKNSNLFKDQDAFKSLSPTEISLEILEKMSASFDYYVSEKEAYEQKYVRTNVFAKEIMIDAQAEFVRLNERIVELGKYGNDASAEANKLKEQITELNSKIESTTNAINDKNLFISELESRNGDLHDYITTHEEYNTSGKELDEFIKNEKKDLRVKNKILVTEKEQLISELSDVKLANTEHMEASLNKDVEIAKLKSELDGIKRSRSYRLAHFSAKAVAFFLPYNSRRRLFVSLMFKMLRHPIFYLKKMSIKNIKKFFKYLKKEGPSCVETRVIDFHDRNEKTIDPSLNLFQMTPREIYEVITFPKEDNPVVSIIIPVYNQFSYTYGCLESILANTKNVKYEVIIADDVSQDETINIEEIAKNIIVNHNEQNLGFLRNCNNASKLAKGKYVLFLNNDTNVLPGWLDSLVELIESSDDIGMVGSKLIYPDGRLQEAGGIIWQEANGWNYGRLQDASKSEYNYVKDVDYISGASLMIKNDLWKEIGGFDERYAPAYFEDSDLAFSVRAKGKRVVYDPFSVVVHYEGISNGTDVKKGIKSYQVANKAKFQEKWHDELLKQNNDAVDVFHARDRSLQKKTILVIDHYVPFFDKDAGSRTIYGYLQLFVSMGYNVKFMGDNFFNHEPYTSALQKLGIEVLYGSYYANNYEKWLKENNDYIDFIFLSRPHVSIKYVDFIKENLKAKTIYYGHDLHHLRYEREYHLTDNPESLVEAKKWREMEFSIYDKVDLIYYPSIVEVEYLKKINPNYNVKILQPYLYKDLQNLKYEAKYRRDILFVGGFTHVPNIDGITWFVEEKLPSIIKKDPTIKVIIVGSNPTKQIMDLASDNVIVRGYVSDEELTSIYERVRLIIAPLRFGAGIKGKVVEALSYGIPVVTTNVGAEGLSTDCMIVDDDFTKLVDVYNDYALLDKLSPMEKKYINDEFTFNSALEKIKIDF